MLRLLFNARAWAWEPDNYIMYLPKRQPNRLLQMILGEARLGRYFLGHYFQRCLSSILL